jgi:hypothetical protein
LVELAGGKYQPPEKPELFEKGNPGVSRRGFAFSEIKMGHLLAPASNYLYFSPRITTTLTLYLFMSVPPILLN